MDKTDRFMQELKALSRKRGLLSIAAILRDWAVIAAMAAASIRVGHWAFYILAVWIIGFFQFALSEAMLHEAAHYNLFRWKRLHHAFEFFYGLPFFRTVTLYQPEHRIHHSRLGGEDDELINDYRSLGLFRDDVSISWIWIFKPILGFGIYYMTILTLRPWREGVKIVAFWVPVLAACFYFGWMRILVLYWFVPLVWANYSFVYWSEIENHYNTVSGTRTNVSPLFNLIAHNGGYHAVHHKYPTIPWFNLKKAHALWFAGCDDLSNGFLDTYRQLRRNVTESSVPVFVRPSRATAS
jgi:fatty acid desaturase